MTAITSTSICNDALVFLGERPLLTFPEESLNSDYCNIFYSRVKAGELTKHPWNFATDRIQLTQIATAPICEYPYQYQIPINLLKLLDVYPSDARWRREKDSILAECTPLYARGIFNVNEEDFSVLFASTVAARLAMFLAPIITERDIKFNQAASWYQDVVADARRADASEESIDQMDDLDVVRKRGPNYLAGSYPSA